MYIDQTLLQFLDDLSSSKPTPGGGSASAVSGAMGAALASMVCRLTLDKDEYAGVREEIATLLERTENLRQRFQQLMQEDIEAYGKLSEIFKLPRETKEERAARSRAIQEQLAQAALVPLEVTEAAAELMQACLRISEIGNTRVLSDIATGAMLASSAGAGAAWMVRINLQSMKDLEKVTLLGERLSAALDQITDASQQVTTIVGSRT
ncbi:MAG TPA: cyclodeaminase/cyclohydrolase family protein [Ktedonobacteraceae bacterium]|nr:cyclodeaminase/cyclohydrolase family protein [Ktedonobacteraceae bacterium]